MTLLELAQEIGLDLKKTSNSKGGEYHSACPHCGEGLDRFVIWPELNRYWCRRCDINGDDIQFCRDFMQMSFREASLRIQRPAPSPRKNRQRDERLAASKEPPKEWQEKASAFVDWAHKQLTQSPSQMLELKQRGFRDNTILRFKLGFSMKTTSRGSQDFFRERVEWGLPLEYKSVGQQKKLWLPSGLVIPTYSSSGCVYKLKVRRQGWQQNDPLPKYVEISGSKSCPSIYGDTTSKVAIILESELDAMLIQQEAEDTCFCVALGGASKRPDIFTSQLLDQTSLILWCLDNDEAGKKAALWWREMYPHLRFWPVPIGKSPGDALKDHGMNLREWLLRGVTYYKQVPQTNQKGG